MSDDKELLRECLALAVARVEEGGRDGGCCGRLLFAAATFWEKALTTRALR